MTGAALPAGAVPTPPAPVPPPPAAPQRRFAVDPATRLPTIAVAAVLAVLFFGSQLVNEALPGGTQRVGSGETVSVGGFVTFAAAGGWEVTPHDSGDGIRLEKGVVAIDIFPESVSTDGAGLARAYLAQALEAQSSELTATDLETAADGATTGARFRYQGIFPGAEGPLEGEVTAFVAGGHGVVVDAWSPQGSLDTLIDEVRRMVSTVEVRR